MAFTPSTPDKINLPGPKVEKDLTRFHLHKLEILSDPADDKKTIVNVEWSKGYMDDDKYVVHERVYTSLRGDSLLKAMTAKSTGKTIYEEVKQAVWKLLQDQKHVPVGTIS